MPLWGFDKHADEKRASNFSEPWVLQAKAAPMAVGFFRADEVAQGTDLAVGVLI